MYKIKTSPFLNQFRMYKVPYHYVKSYVVCALLVAMALIEIFADRSYHDEALAIVAIVYLIVIRNKLSRYDLITIILLAITVGIGLLSNLTSGVSRTWFSVGIDVISTIKLLVVYFAAKYFINDKVKDDILYLLTPISKLFCIAAFICAVISQFKDIGMTNGDRYGANSFTFVFPMSFQYMAVYMVVFICILTSKRMINEERFFFIAISLVSLSLATKSSQVIFTACFILLALYFRFFKKLNLWVLIPLAAVIIMLGSYQIETYLTNIHAPRYLFFKYGFQTANNFFPFGSGFATFGSDQAARNYSPLYYQYGFNKLFGMNTVDGSFLSDTFWPMVIGQFGWIGTITYGAVYIMMFFSFGRQYQMTKMEKAFIYACFIQYMVHAVGSAILSSSAGMIGFIAMGMLISPTPGKDKNRLQSQDGDNKNKPKHTRIKINVRH